jgi:20S proteasome subunit beta 1
MKTGMDINLGGSGSTFIKGYADLHFKKNMTKAEARKFIIDGVQLAIKRDCSSGGNIRLIDITEEKVTREMIPYSEFEIR